MIKRAGLLGGIALLVALAAAPAPHGMSSPAQLTAAVAACMAVWWLTEAVPVAATALIPLVAFPLLGVMGAGEVSAPYASKTNMLFLGGLMIATALERWDLHKRIALNVVALFGTSAARLVLGFMCGTALVSMWISNSATTMMMLPIALAVCEHIGGADRDTSDELSRVLLLAVAYSASIGGLGTIVGTPPNAVFVGAFEQLFPEAPQIGFLQWMLVGVPIVAVMIPLAWIYLVYVASGLGRRATPADDRHIRVALAALGPMTTAERRVLLVFATTAGLWMFRRPIDIGALAIPGWAGLLPAPEMVGDSTVAIAMALLLFVVPAGDPAGSRLLTWQWAVRLPWGVIVLLGGGFALAEAIRVSGLAAWIGASLAWVGAAAPLVAIVCVALAISFFTEVTTNTATTTIMMPVLAASAVSGGCDPLLLMIPCTLAASLCFMLPSGTAPNAIVFSGGTLTVAYMARTGIGLNVIAVAIVAAATYSLAVPIFGISLEMIPDWTRSLR